MKRMRLFVVMAAAAIACARVLAQGSGLQAETSPAPLACLTTPADPIAYPAGLAEKKMGGVLRVRMTFERADAAPKAEVFYDSVGLVFKDLVLARVGAYRLPCLQAGALPVTVTQEFVFTPGDGRAVTWSPLRRSDSAWASTMNCLVGAEKVPDFPFSVSSKYQGSVIARYRFSSADAAPTVEILFDGGQERFAEVVREYAAGLRLPCLKGDAIPLTATQTFRFQIEGAPWSQLKDAPLVSFVRGIDNVGKENVRFDFTTMACPFEVQFVLRQPYLDNEVGEVGRGDPNRREFIEWLRRIDLKVPAKVRPQVVGDSMTIAVPCGVLDLT